MRHDHGHHHGDEWAPPFARRRGRRGGGFGPPWAGGGARARRGDVRTAILVLLAERPMHGYQVIQELSERTGGEWRPSPGSVYPTLQLLEESGAIAAEEVDGKRVFALTDEGRALLQARGDQAPPWASFSGPSGGLFHELKEAFFQLGAAGMQVVQTGSSDQAKATLDILVEARKKIYALLADGA
jgi:DNA-binding PadR family transcriptional regulator